MNTVSALTPSMPFEAPSIHIPLCVGVATMVFSLGGIASWSVFAPLASAVSAPATIVVGMSNQVVQHADGGVVDRVLAKEGSLVEEHDPIVALTDVTASSLVQALTEQVRSNAEEIGRLALERKFPVPPNGIDSRPPGLEAGSLGLAPDQRRLFVARREALSAKLAALASEIEQSRDVLRANGEQVALQNTRITSLDRDLAAARFLSARGDGTRDRVSQFERAGSELKSQLSELMAKSDFTRHKIDLSEIEARRERATFDEAVETQYQQALRDQIDLCRRLADARFHRDNLVIRAPAAGRIVGLTVHTVGAVVQPGAIVAEVVPQHTPLVVEAQVRPSDIQAVQVGATVDIRVSGEEGHVKPRITGHVVLVSADRLFDHQSGASYFAVRVETDIALPDTAATPLMPGMSAQIWISKGTKSVAQYLIEPVHELLRSGLRD